MDQLVPGVPAPRPSSGHALTPSIQISPRDSDPWLLRTHEEFLSALPAEAS